MSGLSYVQNKRIIYLSIYVHFMPSNCQIQDRRICLAKYWLVKISKLPWVGEKWRYDTLEKFNHRICFSNFSSCPWTHTPRCIAYIRLLLIEARTRHMGPSIKYVTLQRGSGSEKVWQFVTGEGGVKIMWRHTFHCFTIHNFTFYFIFYHA